MLVRILFVLMLASTAVAGDNALEYVNKGEKYKIFDMVTLHGRKGIVIRQHEDGSYTVRFMRLNKSLDEVEMYELTVWARELKRAN